MKRRAFMVASAACVLPTVLRAKEIAELELILALDQSESMARERGGIAHKHWNIQRDGHIAALKQAGVRQRLLGQSVYVRLVYWSGHTESFQAPYGRFMRSEQDIDDLISTIMTTTPATKHTGTRHDLLIQSVRDLPPRGRRRVIDVSSDQEVRAEYKDQTQFERDIWQTAGHQINVLAIDSDDTGAVPRDLKRDLQTHPVGFTIPVQGWDYTAYTLALYDKLMRELM